MKWNVIEISTMFQFRHKLRGSGFYMQNLYLLPRLVLALPLIWRIDYTLDWLWLMNVRFILLRLNYSVYLPHKYKKDFISQRHLWYFRESTALSFYTFGVLPSLSRHALHLYDIIRLSLNHHSLYTFMYIIAQTHW